MFKSVDLILIVKNWTFWDYWIWMIFSI